MIKYRSPIRRFSAFSSTQFEFTKHDLLPKEDIIIYREEHDQVYGIKGALSSLKLTSGSDDRQKYDLWQQLSREAVKHIKSLEFRDEFYKLIRNDDIHVRLLSLHLWLLSDRLKQMRPPPFIKSPS